MTKILFISICLYYFPFIWTSPDRLNDVWDLLDWVTNINMQILVAKNPHYICKTRDILDDWRFELINLNFGDLKPILFRFTWLFLNNYLSGYISSRYFITIKTLILLIISLTKRSIIILKNLLSIYFSTNQHLILNISISEKFVVLSKTWWLIDCHKIRLIKYS